MAEPTVEFQVDDVVSKEEFGQAVGPAKAAEERLSFRLRNYQYDELEIGQS